MTLRPVRPVRSQSPDWEEGDPPTRRDNSDWIPDFKMPVLFKGPWKDSWLSDILETLGMTVLILLIVWIGTIHPSNPFQYDFGKYRGHPYGWAVWISHPLVVGSISLIVFTFVRNNKPLLKVLAQFLIGFTLAIGFATLWFYYRRT
jgi:hypothetical protein